MFEYRMDCGCKFKAYSEIAKECDGLPPITIDYYNLPYCAKSWIDVGEGKVKGVFQVEKHLGKKWCSEIHPMNIEELSAIIAIMRPGVLESIVDGKSLTKKYADRKNGIEDPIPLHPILGTILEKTQNILIYQEQIILISQKIAGFTGVEADTLRRGIGHKDPKVVNSMEEKFVQGCVKTSNMSEKDAHFIFDIIKKSQRYLFNACLTPDTVVETESGLKTIEDLQIGEFVKSPDGFIEVLNKYDNGSKEVYEITLESGKTIKCTLDHKFLCSSGEILPLETIIEKDLQIVCEEE